ncbi:MAG TPA: hypothetical protein PLT31_08530 [Fibrobacteraceae bacterium]|nr:hypothetical protein [Fibrobacteraceae bacterium]
MEKKHFFLLIWVVLLASCLYDPEPYQDSSSTKQESTSSDMGTIFPINTGKQICNPSISNDTVLYPASILWLNFSGALVVKDPPSDFTVNKVVQHDRLTVSDTAGRVQWFVMRDSIGVECQFQDPEWSTHPDYIVALGGFNAPGIKNCSELDYGIMGIRLADKKAFWFVDSNIIEEAFPHLWVDPNVNADTSALDSLEEFFGTKFVQLVYVDKNDKIAWVDYSKSNKITHLKKPSDKSSWRVDSPLISPDGKWVIYNLMNNAYSWEAYIQELSANSDPIPIPFEQSMMSAPAQPHWWLFQNRLFIVWAEFPSGQTMLNKSDFLDASVYDGSVGRTAMREVSLIAGGIPSDMAVEWKGSVREIAKVPMTGGRSPDGHFMATGTNYGYILELP